MTTALILLGAAAAGMIVQAIFAFKQTSAFSAAVRELRRHGSVAVGGAGKRYRGGKAFVAIASDPQGRVTKAISLTGWTTFARPTEVWAVQGMSLASLQRDEPIPSVDLRAQSAFKNAAQTLNRHLSKVA